MSMMMLMSDYTLSRGHKERCSSHKESSGPSDISRSCTDSVRSENIITLDEVMICLKKSTNWYSWAVSCIGSKVQLTLLGWCELWPWEEVTVSEIVCQVKWSIGKATAFWRTGKVEKKRVIVYSDLTIHLYLPQYVLQLNSAAFWPEVRIGGVGKAWSHDEVLSWVTGEKRVAIMSDTQTAWWEEMHTSGYH